MKNYVDLEHDKLAEQWDLIHKKEKAIEEKLEEIELLEPTWGNHQVWHEADGPYYLAKAKKELENLIQSKGCGNDAKPA